jgi:S-adenosylmethionine:tRNA ribosyltransferase-isomerase
VVRRLKSPLEHPGPASRVFCGVREHFRELALVKMVRAGTCNKDASRPEQPHRTVIDLLIAAEGRLDGFTAFREGGRIEDDGVVALALSLTVPKEIESIRFKGLDVRQAIPLRIRPHQFDCRGRDIDSFNTVADLADLESEPPGVAERIESPAAGVTPAGAMVVALIEIGTCLLPAGQGKRQMLTVFINDYGFRYWLAGHFLLQFKSFEFSHPAIISEENGRRRVALGQNLRHQRLKFVGGLDEALDDKPVVIAIDHQARQKVALGINSAAEQRINGESFAQTVGEIEPLAKECLVDRNVGAGQKSKSDLRCGTVEGLAENPAPFVVYGDDTAGRCVRALHVTTVNPYMAPPKAIDAAPANDDLAAFHPFTPMHISDFDFELPAELIAREPVRPRDASRMLVLDRKTGQYVDSEFRKLPEFLKPSDVLVLNDTRVIRARVAGQLRRRNGTVRDVEVLFAAPISETTWEVMCRPGKRVREGDRIRFSDGLIEGVFGDLRAHGLRTLHLSEPVEAFLESHGHIPLPPYINRKDTAEDNVEYQTIYAAASGAVAAPTAGLHFSAEMFEALRERGIEVVNITLHVGLGTFIPVRTEDPAQHVLKPERFHVTARAAARLNGAQEAGRRIVAVGTTTTRTLEYVFGKNGRFIESSGEADLFILPGYQFKTVGAMLTNFHLPESTLIMLVSAFVSREKILAAYRHAVEARYRFYSYGDCMLIAG